MPNDENANPESAEVEVVKEEDIGEVRLGTWTQRAGMRLAAYVGAAGVAIIFIILVKWWFLTPKVPVLLSNLKPEEAEALPEELQIVM